MSDDQGKLSPAAEASIDAMRQHRLAQTANGKSLESQGEAQPESAGHKAIIGMFDLLGLTFALPLGEELFRGNSIPLSHWIYGAVGVLFAGFGHMWPITRTIVPRLIRKAVPQAAEDGRVWIALILTLFLVGMGPELYQRAIAGPPNSLSSNAPSADEIAVAVAKALPAPVSPSADTIATAIVKRLPGPATAADEIEKATASIAAERDAAKQEVVSLRSQLNAALKDRDVARQMAAQAPPPAPQPSSPTPEDQTPINWQPTFAINYNGEQKIIWIQFIGQSTALADVKDAYILSDLTGHRQPLEVANPTNFTQKWKVSQIEPIVPGAQIRLIYELDPPLSAQDFLLQWGAVEFHVVYDGKEYVRKYQQDFINKELESYMPGIVGPRVTPKVQK